MRPSVATILSGLALLLTGLFFGSPPLELPGLALIILALSLRGWVAYSARHLRIETTPSRPTAIEGERYTVRAAIHGVHRLTPEGWIEHPLLDQRVKLPAPLPDTVEFVIRFPRRGRHQIGAPSLAVADPLGMHEVRTASSDRARVLVLPRIGRVELADHAAGADGVTELARLESLLDGSASVRSAGMDVDVDGLRPHQPGSPSSRIHWPTVARTGEMFERLLVANAAGGPLVVLDCSHAESAEALDRAVRAAASLCHALATVGGCSLLIGGRERPLSIDRSMRTWPTAHAALALAEPSAKPPAIRGRRLDPAFWVTAAPLTPGLRSSLPSSAFVVSPAPLPSPSFTVAGCFGEPARRVPARRAVAA